MLTSAGTGSLAVLLIDCSHLLMAAFASRLDILAPQDRIIGRNQDYTLHFMDPPYWETEGYGAPFPLNEYDKIAESMRTMKGSAALTIK
jgi:DNA adenine methylase